MMFISPAIERLGNKFWAVVDLNANRYASTRSHAVQHIDHVLAPDCLVHPDRQTLACIRVDQRQRAELAAVMQLITDKIHRPAFVHALRNRQSAALPRGAMTSWTSLEQR